MPIFRIFFSSSPINSSVGSDRLQLFYELSERKLGLPAATNYAIQHCVEQQPVFLPQPFYTPNNFVNLTIHESHVVPYRIYDLG